MSARDRILGRIVDSQPSPIPTITRMPTSGCDLWEVFWAKLQLLGGQKANRSVLEGKTIWAEPSTELSCSAELWDAEIGVSRAICAIAETGSLLLTSGPGSSRLSSLVPPVHFVLVDRSAIVATLEDAIIRMPDRNCVWVTGPSRTADIEGVLVRGVHGPGELLVCVEDYP